MCCLFMNKRPNSAGFHLWIKQWIGLSLHTPKLDFAHGKNFLLCRSCAKTDWSCCSFFGNKEARSWNSRVTLAAKREITETHSNLFHFSCWLLLDCHCPLDLCLCSLYRHCNRRLLINHALCTILFASRFLRGVRRAIRHHNKHNIRELYNHFVSCFPARN